MALNNCSLISADFLTAGDGNRTILQVLYESLQKYQPVHGWLCLGLCSFSLCTNFLNVLVFLRRHMVNAVTFTLAAIAICDIVTWTPYLIYVIRFNLSQGPGNFGWIFFLEVHAILTVLGHCSNLWLSVAVAYMRLNVLRESNSPRPGLMSLQRSKRLVLFVVIFVIISTIPPLTATYPQTFVDGRNETVWYITFSPYHLQNQCLGFLICMWSVALIHKLAPCMFLAYYVFSLIHHLRTYERKSQRIRGANTQSRTGDKTTITLICLVSVSLITELPQGAVLFLYGMNPLAAMMLYTTAGDLLDLLSLINSSVNFIFYILMNTQYRQEVYLLLTCKPDARSRRRHSATGTAGFNSVAVGNNKRLTINNDNNTINLRRSSASLLNNCD